MKIKTANLSGAALDWAVAKCEGWDDDELLVESKNRWETNEYNPQYSTNWAFGGPIIEQERISPCPSTSGSAWVAHLPMLPTSQQCFYGGPTPLIAAMRCYITSKLGDEVDIPEELL